MASTVLEATGVIDALPCMEILRSTYNLGELVSERSTIVALDDDSMIRWLNPAWTQFAQENGAPNLAARFGLGASYMDGVAEPLRSFFHSAFFNVLATGDAFTHTYECSSPTVKRVHRMHVVSLDGHGLLIEHSLVRQAPVDLKSAEPFEANYRDERGFVLQCSNCRRVRGRDGRWDWVPAWVAEMPPDTSHGLCATCASRYFHATVTARKKRT